MKPLAEFGNKSRALKAAAEYGRRFRLRQHPLHPSASALQLRESFCIPLPDAPTAPDAVIRALIAAAEPGLVGNTDPNFYAWVMGGSDEVGVAADWLTSIWGQNAAIFQTSPASAIAEEAVAAWLLELLDLPRGSSVGLVTGATMAGFTCLAAARDEVLARAGHDFARYGLQGAPLVHIFLSDDAHASNLAALRHLGLGQQNIVPIRSDDNGLVSVAALEDALKRYDGPKIIIGQAGHINSGGFDDFDALSRLSAAHGAWLHVDGAFGLWLRVLPEKAAVTRAIEAADSWSVDGHKWLQLPYDSGFAIVRNTAAHRRAMDIEAGYLNESPEDGRNPTEFNPELSRRARGFAAWATLLSLGKDGVRELIDRHCGASRALMAALGDIPKLELLGTGDSNQVALGFDVRLPDHARLAGSLAQRLNADHGVFVRTAVWKGRHVLRLSITSGGTTALCIDRLGKAIRAVWATVLAEAQSS